MHGVVSCSFIHHRSSICSDHVPSSTAEYQLTNTVKIKQCSCVMQGLSILSFGNNLCILHKNLLFSVSLAKCMGRGTSCLRVFIHPLAEVSQWKFGTSQEQVSIALLSCKTHKNGKGRVIFPVFFKRFLFQTSLFVCVLNVSAFWKFPPT